MLNWADLSQKSLMLVYLPPTQITDEHGPQRILAAVAPTISKNFPSTKSQSPCCLPIMRHWKKDKELMRKRPVQPAWSITPGVSSPGHSMPFPAELLYTILPKEFANYGQQIQQHNVAANLEDISTWHSMAGKDFFLLRAPTGALGREWCGQVGVKGTGKANPGEV